MENFEKYVGNLIRTARTEEGLTQKELAEKVGVGEPTINKYESGRQNLTVKTLKKVADAMGLKINITFHK